MIDDNKSFVSFYKKFFEFNNGQTSFSVHRDKLTRAGARIEKVLQETGLSPEQAKFLAQQMCKLETVNSK